MSKDELEEIIEKYSAELLKMSRSNPQTAEQADEDMLEKGEKKPDEEFSVKEGYDSDEVAEDAKTPSEAESEGENEASGEKSAVSAEEVSETTAVESAADSSAYFSARVFYSQGALPVEGAKVVVYRGDEIFSFLETDESGNTKRVSLPAYSEENTLAPEDSQQRLDYYADVFAKGFSAKKGLLVSAVGGSEILLDVQLVPESERIS